MYNIDICRRAIEAEQQHALSVISIDNSPDRDSYMDKLPFCECPGCAPHMWPNDIEEQLDEFYENNGPGTFPIDI